MTSLSENSPRIPLRLYCKCPSLKWQVVSLLYISSYSQLVLRKYEPFASQFYSCVMLDRLMNRKVHGSMTAPGEFKDGVMILCLVDKPIIICLFTDTLSGIFGLPCSEELIKLSNQ